MCTDRGQEAGGCRQAHTHVGFAEGHVYNAADYDEGVKRIPGVTKIPLDRAGRGQTFMSMYERNAIRIIYGDTLEAP